MLSCSGHSVLVMRHQRRTLVTGTSAELITEGEYMETEARLEIPGPGGVTSVDTDGRIVLIGQI